MGSVIKIERPIPDDGNLYFQYFPDKRWRCLNTINANVKKAEEHLKRKLKNKETL